jgi:hypothetical protein
MFGKYCIVYGLLVTVVIALILSFMQLYRRPVGEFRTFVPRSHVLWLKHYISPRLLVQMRKRYSVSDFSSFHNKLVLALTQSYHVMTLYLLSSDYYCETESFEHADTLFRTYIALYSCQCSVLSSDRVSQTDMVVGEGDVVTLPSHFTLRYDRPDAFVCLCWGLHPVSRPYKTCQRERAYIHQQWSKRKLNVVISPLS